MLTNEFEGNDLVIQKNERKHTINLRIASSKLFEASESELQLYRISPSGYGIHWSLIDEDLSIEKLLNL